MTIEEFVANKEVIGIKDGEMIGEFQGLDVKVEALDKDGNNSGDAIIAEGEEFRVVAFGRHMNSTAFEDGETNFSDIRFVFNMTAHSLGNKYFNAIENSSNVRIGELKIISVTRESIKAYQIVDIKNKRFKLHCNQGRSMVCGFNSDLCVKLVLDNGELKNIVDNGELGLKANFGYAKDENENKANVAMVFNGFIEHLKELYL